MSFRFNNREANFGVRIVFRAVMKLAVLESPWTILLGCLNENGVSSIMRPLFDALPSSKYCGVGRHSLCHLTTWTTSVTLLRAIHRRFINPV
jgi:hypothetical protein